MLVLLALLPLSSCRKAPPPKADEGAAAATGSVATPEQCERTLDNLLDGLAPGRFGISSDRGVLVDTLNNWNAQCADPDEFSSTEEDAALRAKLLPEDVYALTAHVRFTDQDAGYFRNVMLVRDMVDATLLDERADLQRAVSLFYKVVRTIDLRHPETRPPIFGPYETALFGKGTAADRAWLFGMMLRQLRLDAVVIRPRSADAGESRSFLVGVIVPVEGVYLFDLQLGLPITAPSEADGLPLPRNPITLAEARENDAVFRQYDMRGMTFPVKAGQLADVAVLAIGENSTWAPRFGSLQAALTAPLEAYDGLLTHTFREHGLFERLVIAGSEGLWDEQAVGIWDYPDSVYRDAPQMTKDEQQQLLLQARVLTGPISVRPEERDGKVVPVFSQPKQNLRQARVRHLQGDYKPALGVYLKTRLAAKRVLDKSIPENIIGSDWCAYWAALAQYDQEDFDVAAETAEQYLKTPGEWIAAAIGLRAKALAYEGQFRAAANTLVKEPIQSPQRAGDQWLVRHWRKLAKAASQARQAESVAEKNPQPPTDEPAAKPTTEPPPTSKPQTDKPQSGEPQTAEEQPPDPEARPKQSPDDLPPGEARPDPRFEDEPSRDESADDEA